MNKFFRIAFLSTLLSFACGLANASLTLNNITLNLVGGTPDAYQAPATPALHTVWSTGSHLVIGYVCGNSSTAMAWLHPYATTTVTIGTTASVGSLPCPGQSTGGAGAAVFIPIGINYGSTAFAYYVSGGPLTTDNTAVTVSTISITLIYQ